MAMTLLQLKVDSKLKKAIKDRAQAYGITSSAIVKMVLSDTFLKKETYAPGNVFNANRDNSGKGIPIDEFIALLEKYDGQSRKISAKTGSGKAKKTSGKVK
jgi:hypothetical protein